MAETLEQFLNRTKPVGGAAPAAAPAAASPAAAPGPQVPTADPVTTFLTQTKPQASGAPGMPGSGPPAAESTPSTLLNDPRLAASRIGGAAIKGWQDTPSFWTPEGRNALDYPLEGAPPAVRSLLEPTVAAFTRGVVKPAGDLVSGAFGLGAAAFRGGQQVIQEAGTAAGQPQLGRDAAAYFEAFPFDPHFAPPGTFRAPKYQGARDMAGADTVATNHYRISDNSGLTFSPDFINKSLDSASPRTERQLAKETTEGRTKVTEQLERLDKFRDKPMTIQQWQGLNEGLNTAIGKEISIDGITPEGRQLQQIQRKLREQVDAATEGDLIAGGREGLDAFKRGNEAYSQARKMEVLEKMWTYAEGTANPTTSIKQQVGTFVRNEKKHRGWSEEELKALQDAADRGTIGDFVHTMGSRLVVPLAATAAIPAFETMTGGGPSMFGAVGAGLAGSTAAYMAGSPFRGIGRAMAERRMRNTFDVLGERVPPNPLNIPEP